jgi:hypothetical protein
LAQHHQRLVSCVFHLVSIRRREPECTYFHIGETARRLRRPSLVDARIISLIAVIGGTAQSSIESTKALEFRKRTAENLLDALDSNSAHKVF